MSRNNVPAKSCRIDFMCSESEKDLIHALCEALNVTLAEFMRQLVHDKHAELVDSSFLKNLELNTLEVSDVSK